MKKWFFLNHIILKSAYQKNFAQPINRLFPHSLDTGNQIPKFSVENTINRGFFNTLHNPIQIIFHRIQPFWVSFPYCNNWIPLVVCWSELENVPIRNRLERGQSNLRILKDYMSKFLFFVNSRKCYYKLFITFCVFTKIALISQHEDKLKYFCILKGTYVEEGKTLVSKLQV